MGNDSEHKLCTSKDFQMRGILAVLLGILAFILIFIACVPNYQATSTAEKRRDATVVARAASKAMRNIQATNTAKTNESVCLAQPTKCRSLGLDWTRTTAKCRAVVRSGGTALSYSDCLPHTPVPIQIRVTPRSQYVGPTPPRLVSPPRPQPPQVPKPPRP